LRDLVAVLAGHADVGEHDVGRRRLEPLDRLIAVADRDDGHVLVGKGQLDHALNRDAVVGKEKGVRHSQGYRYFRWQTSECRSVTNHTRARTFP
jgi:hypothetical protein